MRSQRWFRKPVCQFMRWVVWRLMIYRTPYHMVQEVSQCNVQFGLLLTLNWYGNMLIGDFAIAIFKAKSKCYFFTSF